MASLTADSPQGEIRMSLENFGRLGKNNFELDFSVGNRFSKTGKGDQFRIFSTVIQGLKMIIDKEKDEINPCFATSTDSAALISLIILSISFNAFNNPSKICALFSDFLRSKVVLLVTISILCFK